jgi:hypothetical protein
MAIKFFMGIKTTKELEKEFSISSLGSCNFRAILSWFPERL